MNELNLSYIKVFTFLKWYCVALLAYSIFMPDKSIFLQCILLGGAIYFDLFRNVFK